MNTRKTYLTDVGIQKLTDELTELTEKQRPELAKRLRDAIKMGDLSENADYIREVEDVSHGGAILTKWLILGASGVSFQAFTLYSLLVTLYSLLFTL